MPNLERKSLDQPEETLRHLAKGVAEFVTLGEGRVRRGTFEPGWRWSEHVAPIAGTPFCLAPHLGYVLAGRMRLQMTDGQAIEVAPGDTYLVPGGQAHDAWVVGGETCITLDFAAMLASGPPP